MANFLLSNIRSNPKADPEQIYHIFHKKIQEQQLKEILILRKAFDIIDDTVRQLSLVTETPEQKREQDLKVDILRQVEHKIREAHAKPGADFLDSLKRTLNFKPPQN